MLDNDFEKYIKNNLESARMDWDKEDMWSQIEDQLPKEEPKRFVPFWIFCGGVALLILATTLYFTLDKNKNNSQQDELELAEAETSSKTKSDRLTKTVNNDDAIYNIENNTTNATEKQVVNSESEKPKTPEPKITSNINSKKNQASFTSKSPFFEDVPVKESTSKTKAEIVPNADHQGAKASYDAKGNGLDVEAKWQNSNEGDIESSLLNRKLKEASFINWPTVEWASRSLDLNFAFANNATQILPVPKHKLSELYGFGKYSILSRTLKGDASQSELLDQRLNSETVLEGLGLQLGYRHFINRHVFVEAGLEYLRINEKLDFEQKVSEQIVVQSDTANHYVNYAGVTQYVPGDKVVEKITTTPFLKYNEHHFLMIPVHVGFRLALNKFEVDFTTGPVFNIYQSYKGDIIDTNLLLVEDYSPIEGNSSVLGGIDVGCHINYNLGKGLAVTSGLGLRKSFSDFSVDDIIDQSYNSLDLKLGLLIKI